MTLQLALEDYGQNPKARGKPPPPRRGYWVERVMPHPCWAAASSCTCREGSRGEGVVEKSRIKSLLLSILLASGLVRGQSRSSEVNPFQHVH